MNQDRNGNDTGPFLGKTTLIEPISESASDELLAALLESKADLLKYMPWDCWSLEAVNGFIEGSMHARDEGARFEFIIRERGAGSLIGVIGLKGLDPFTPRAEVGYWVRSSMAGKGYATDALSTLLDFCGQELKLTRIDAQVAESNAASQKVLTKCGFEREGFKRKGELFHGQWLDMILFGKLLS